MQVNSHIKISWVMQVYSHIIKSRSVQIQISYNPRANGAKRRSGRKPGARVTNSARLFTPGKMRTQRSVKSINNHGRVTMFQSQWFQFKGEPPTDLKNMADRQEWKGQTCQRFKIKYVRKITQHEEVFLTFL